MIKKMILLSTILIFSNNLLAEDNTYNDVEYMVDKQRVKHTIETLELIKNKYDENSKDYKIISMAQSHFIDKLPVDTFGTYTRMKLHNIIDNAHIVEKKSIPKYKILSSDIDLNTLYNEQKSREKETEKEIKEVSKNQNIQNQFLNSMQKTYDKNKNTPPSTGEENE
jgi:hypothetical protein